MAQPAALLEHGDMTEASVDPFRFVVARSEEQLLPYVDAWRQLGERALVRNPFYEPFLLLPALRHLAGPGVQILLAFRRQPDGETLAGVIPLDQACGRTSLLGHVRTTWQHPYCFLAAPLLDAGHAWPLLAALARWEKQSGCTALQVQLPGHAPMDQLRHHATLVELEQIERPCFQPARDADAYLRLAVSGQRLKHYRRLERHLGELGQLTVERTGPGADGAAWREEFLQLEAAGWKGRAGTAVACHDEHRRFFEEAVQAGLAEGRMWFQALRLNGRAVAMEWNCRSGRRAFALKSCYDEAYAKYSPGALLELHNIRYLHQAGILWMDSCADGQHSLLPHLWAGRLAYSRVLIMPPVWTPGRISATAVSAVRQTKALWAEARANAYGRLAAH